MDSPRSNLTHLLDSQDPALRTPHRSNSDIPMENAYLFIIIILLSIEQHNWKPHPNHPSCRFYHNASVELRDGWFAGHTTGKSEGEVYDRYGYAMASIAVFVHCCSGSVKCSTDHSECTLALQIADRASQPTTCTSQREYASRGPTRVEQ